MFTQAVIWVIDRIRPHFFSALCVLFIGALMLITSAVQVLIELAFGEPAAIDFGFLGFLIGSIGTGALISGLLRDFVTGIWLRVTLFGAISGLTAGLLIELQHGPPIDASSCILMAMVTAGLFLAGFWALLWANKDNATSPPQQTDNSQG
jgi:hypothetical protein